MEVFRLNQICYVQLECIKNANQPLSVKKYSLCFQPQLILDPWKLKIASTHIWRNNCMFKLQQCVNQN